jgi:protein-L-isoaspartate(D-aspartate) O-methyltransferase
MVIPVGPPAWQQLLLVTKNPDGSRLARPVEDVRFVELRGKYGWGQDA